MNNTDSVIRKGFCFSAPCRQTRSWPWSGPIRVSAAFNLVIPVQAGIQAVDFIGAAG
ncbi:MAG: hypothetical protein NTY41_13335 [Proteobacteria bacterium]|nr:hypothetical protein [Pseudomonadota bacterium]